MNNESSEIIRVFSKRHHYESHTTINPTGIVPVGAELDLSAPHGRKALA